MEKTKTVVYARVSSHDQRADLERAMAGSSFPYNWNPDRPDRVGLLPWDGDASQIAWCEVEPC